MVFEISDPKTGKVTGYVPKRAVFEAFNEQRLEPKTYDMIGRGMIKGYKAVEGFSYGNKELRVLVQEGYRLLPVDEAC